MGVPPDHGDLTEALLLVVHDRPLLRSRRTGQPDQAEALPEALGGLALGLVVLGLGLLERTPHPHQVVPEAVIGGEQPRIVLGRPQDLLERVLEGFLDPLLPVGQVGGPGVVLGQAHGLVQDDLEVQPVVAELRNEHALHDVRQPVLLEQGRRDPRASLGPALPAHDVVHPVVEDGDRVLERGRGRPDAGGPGAASSPHLVVQGDHLLVVEILGVHR